MNYVMDKQSKLHEHKLNCTCYCLSKLSPRVPLHMRTCVLYLMIPDTGMCSNW